MRPDFYEPPTPTISAFSIRQDSPEDLRAYAEQMFAGFRAAILAHIKPCDIHIQTLAPEGLWEH